MAFGLRSRGQPTPTTNPAKGKEAAMSDYITRQREERARAWEQAKALLDSAAAENRDLSAEENEQFARINADIDARAEVIADLEARAARENEIRAAVKNAPEARPEERKAADITDEKRLRALLKGEVRSVDFERRDVTKGSTGAPVPTSFHDQVISIARYVGPMLDVADVWNTASGENLQVPRATAYSTAGLTAEANAISESDPTFGAFITLGAYKYAHLVQISSEMLTDTGVDLQGFIARNVGQALGYAANAALTTGSGSSQPNGIVTAAAAGVTGSAAVAGVFTYDNLVDLVYSTNAAVRRMPGFGIMGSTTAIANMRKLQDGAGFYVWQPSLQAGQPDKVLGYAVHENPHMAAVAAGAKSVLAGDLKSYIVRQVGGIRLEQSSDFAFADDMVTFKAIIRLDGNLPQTSHVKLFTGGAAS